METSVEGLVSELRSRCVQCRSCDDVCPSHRHGGCTPSLVMASEDGNVKACIGCGKCSGVCAHTDPKKVMMNLKAVALDLRPPQVYRECGYITSVCDPVFSDGLPAPPEGDDVYVMPGCVAKRRVPFVVYAAFKALSYLGLGGRELPGNTCCTYPLVFRQEPQAPLLDAKNAMRDSAGGRDTITLCGGCTHEMAEAGIDFPHVAVYLSRHLEAIRRLPGANLKVSVEPGCAVDCFREEFEAVVRACGCEIVNDTSGCCGKGIPGVNEGLMAEREAESAGADAIVIGCPNCLTAYDTYEGGLPVLHIVELVCLAAGDRFTQRYHRIKLRGI